MVAYLIAVVLVGGGQLFCHPPAGAVVQALTMTAGSSSSSRSSSMWKLLDHSPPCAWNTIFGRHDGERGEYMDAYSPAAMLQRCQDDYHWDHHHHHHHLQPVAVERATMMSHLYDNEPLWKSVCMVAFAEHYVLTNITNNNDGVPLSQPFHTFQRHQASQRVRQQPPIFGGVVWSEWDACEEETLKAYKNQGIDYVRLECNLGTVEDLGRPVDLARHCHERFRRLAEATKACQEHKMVPLLLLQVPWRESKETSREYFTQALHCLANALNTATVEPKRLLLETRPPIGLSAQEERSLSGTEREALGLEIGRTMFEIIEQSFGGDMISGFCVAGGSTKGDHPTAMEDDTQNAVRQGIRQYALRKWNFELCFWEMGAKLMLQPKVGRLWGTNGQAGRDAARELFRVNAENLADEIKRGLQ